MQRSLRGLVVAALMVSFVGCGETSELGDGIPKSAVNQPPPPIPEVDLSKFRPKNEPAPKKPSTPGKMTTDLP